MFAATNTSESNSAGHSVTAVNYFSSPQPVNCSETPDALVVEKS